MTSKEWLFLAALVSIIISALSNLAVMSIQHVQ